MDPNEPLHSQPRLESVAESEATFRVVEQAILGLWKVVNSLSRIRPPGPKYYRVTIFGSSRMQPGDALYEDVRRLTTELAAMGCDIVTGGGPGLMAAANEGERLGDVDNRTRSFGLRIELPFEQAANPFVEKLYMHETFFTRLHHFVRLSSAFIVMPGGIGTTLETMMIWQLLQVRQIHDRPLVLVGKMWPDLVDWARRHMLTATPQRADPEDIDLPTCVETVEEAAAIIREHHARFRADVGARSSR